MQASRFLLWVVFPCFIRHEGHAFLCARGLVHQSRRRGKGKNPWSYAPDIERRWSSASVKLHETKYEVDEPTQTQPPIRMLPGSQTIKESLASPFVEVQLASMVLLSSLLVALDTLPSLPPEFRSFIELLETSIGVTFAIEFMLRWYSQNMSLRHLTSPLTVVDLAALFPLIFLVAPPEVLDALPGVLLSSSSVINLRLLRILRLQRVVLTDLETFGNFRVALGLPLSSEVQPYQLQLARVVLSIFTLVSISTGLIYTAEHSVNPAIPDYFTALYFGLTTLTTVGFGDITPVTFQGRLVVCGSILVGVAVLPAQLASLVDALLDRSQIVGANKNTSTPVLSSLSSTPQSEAPSQNSPNQTVLEEQITSSVGANYDVSRSCKKCNAFPHRSDATFCWSCGCELNSLGVKNINPEVLTTTTLFNRNVSSAI